MAIPIEFRPISEAILGHLDGKEPDEVLFIVGRKKYTAKDVEKHLKKEDRFASSIITYALRVNAGNPAPRSKKVVTLKPKDVSQEQIDKTVQMFQAV